MVLLSRLDELIYVKHLEHIISIPQVLSIITFVTKEYE